MSIGDDSVNSFFGRGHNGVIFELFGTVHLITLGVFLALALGTYVFRKRLDDNRVYNIIRYTIAGILLVNQIGYYIWLLGNGIWTVGVGLPLTLCGIATYLSIYLLLTESFITYEVLYFWGLCGTLQALITPDFGNYGYNHYRYYEFFISHILIVITVLFMTFVKKYRPNIGSMIKSFLWLNIYAGFIFVINIIADTNYLWLLHKPETATLIDFLGPWPWYIVSLEILGIILFMVFYGPFLLKDYIERIQNYKPDNKEHA